MKKLKDRIENFKKEILTIKGEDFMPWYKSLSPIESFLYKVGFKELQKNERKRKNRRKRYFRRY